MSFNRGVRPFVKGIQRGGIVSRSSSRWRRGGKAMPAIVKVWAIPLDFVGDRVDLRGGCSRSVPARAESGSWTATMIRPWSCSGTKPRGASRKVV